MHPYVVPNFFFLLRNTKGDILKNVHTAFFHTMNVDGDQELSLFKKHHKSSAYI